MNVLIVANDPDLSRIWARHLRRAGLAVFCTAREAVALDYLAANEAEVVVLDLMLTDGSPIAVSDYVSYRWPASRVIFVTSDSFFSDGSAFALSPNAAAHLRTDTPPDDLAAVVEYHARAS